jgi:hypothetical protein
MKNALKQSAAVVSHSAHDAEPDDFSVYEEYVRGFDDVPVLQDAVHAPPRPRPPPDFRRGERRDARKEARPDAYAVREDNAAELARLYGEYCGDIPAAPAKRTKTTKTAKRKTGTRKGRRTRAGAGTGTKTAPPSP